MNENNLPPPADWLPPLMPAQAPMPYNTQDQSTIAGMRWNGDVLVMQLYKLLGDYEIKVADDGTQTFERLNPNARPKINDEGLQAVMAIIQSAITPNVSLSRWDEDMANELTKQLLSATAQDIGVNQREWGVEIRNLSTIQNIIKMTILSQLRRAVDGHESQNFKTTTFEQNVQQSLQQNGQQSNFSFWKPLQRGR